MSNIIIKINTEYIKLDSFLKFAGVSSDRGGAKKIIAEGGVTVGGEVCRERGRKLRGGDEIRAEDKTYIIQRVE